MTLSCENVVKQRWITLEEDTKSIRDKIIGPGVNLVKLFRGKFQQN